MKMELHRTLLLLLKKQGNAMRDFICLKRPLLSCYRRRDPGEDLRSVTTVEAVSQLELTHSRVLAFRPR